jgi:hypothetical protein
MQNSKDEQSNPSILALISFTTLRLYYHGIKVGTSTKGTSLGQEG